jgi:undecaprenyl diphosphate synthase
MAKLQHIAFIMDGNRRWAKARGKAGILGHKEGSEILKKIVRACIKKNIPYITFWALSTENLKERTKKELNFLFNLISASEKSTKEFENDGRFVCIGDLSGLPKSCQVVLHKLEQRTKNNTKITVVMAFNYGGRDEIIRAVHRAVKDKKSLTEKNFSEYLDTKDIPDPELLIRTGDRFRLSGFMPWQTVYSELYFTKTLWPDFNEKELDKAIKFFNQTPRNFGK